MRQIKAERDAADAEVERWEAAANAMNSKAEQPIPEKRPQNDQKTTAERPNEQPADRGEEAEEDSRESDNSANSVQTQEALSKEEASDIIAEMEERAEVAPEIELTIENWDAEFGEDGIVNTPIGDVKMGENQFAKLMRQGRNGELGMIKPTLENPDVIIEDISEAKEGDTTERKSSYVYVKTFVKSDGSRYYYFTSVTVSKDGHEVVVFYQEKRRSVLTNLLLKGKLVWKHADDVSTASDIADGLYSSQGNLSDPTSEGTDAPQTTSSDGKDTTNSPITYELGEENSVSNIGEQVQSAEAEVNLHKADAQTVPNPFDTDRVREQRGVFLSVEETRKAGIEYFRRADKNGGLRLATDEKRNVDDEDDPDAVETKMYVPVYTVSYFGNVNSSSDPRVREYDTVDEALANMRYDYELSDRDPFSQLEVKFKEVWVDKDGDVIEEDDEPRSLYDIARKVKLPDEMQQYEGEDSIILHDETFTTGKEINEEKEEEIRDEIEKVLSKETYVLDGKEVHLNVGSLGKYTDIEVLDADGELMGSFTLRIADHSYNPRNNTTAQLAGNFISVVVNYDDPTAEKFHGRYNIYAGIDDSADSVADEVNERVQEIIDEWDADKEHPRYSLVTPESEMTVQEQEAALRDALVGKLQDAGIEVVTDSEQAQRVINEANGEARESAKKRAPETDSSLPKEEYQHTVISGADGTKVLNNLDIIAKECQENNSPNIKTFLGNVAKALGARRHGSSSEYATFETKNGQIVTIRLANHNASTRNFDNAGKDNGISIVVSAKKNDGLANDGEAHVVEFYYDAIKLRKAEGKPLADIVRSIKQALYSGEYKDTTGLAERQEVNDGIREHRVFHGSGADFDLFDHSHMGEGEGTQASLGGLKKASDFILSFLKGGTRQRSSKFEIPERANRLAEKAIGHKINSHTINANELTHAKNRHGVNGSANTENSIPLRDEDFSLMPYIMSAPTRVVKGSMSSNGTESVRYEKDLSNGVVIVVEREGRFDVSDMENITMWAQKKSATNVTVAPRASHSTSETIVISETDAARIRKDAENAIRNDEKLREQKISSHYYPRLSISPVRGEWTKDKIKKRLKEIVGAKTGYSFAARRIAEFDSAEDLADHMFYHGTQYGGGRLKPSILMSDREIERIGGGGYGEKYWGVSVSKSKRVASNFSIGRSVRIYPVILVKNAKVKDMPELKDAADLDDCIVDLWKEGVDAVWIGDKNSGEQELCVLNPAAIVNIDTPDVYQNYKLGTSENPLTIIDSDGISKLYEDSKRYVNALKKKPIKPMKPSRFMPTEDGETLGALKSDEQYQQEMSEYESRLDEYNNSDEVRLFNEEEYYASRNIRFFRTPGGDAYGFTVGGRIYVDTRIATAETPIHEYAHLWATALRQTNPAEWNNVVALMKGTGIWDSVRAGYPELTSDDEIADEVLAHYSGRRGAERLREAQREALAGDGVMTAKLAAMEGIRRVREALELFWRGVADFLGIHFTTAEEVADKVLSDLLHGMKPGGADSSVRFEENAEMADIVARAKADGTYLKAPNGKPSNLSPRQWAQVRTKAFKDWFGNWELAQKVLNIVAAVKEHGFKNFADAKAWANDNIVRTLTNEETGGKGEIRISNNAVSKFLSESAVAKSESKDVHLSVLKVLPDVIRESVDAEQHPDYKKGADGNRSAENGINDNVTIHRLYGAVEIDGNTYRVKVTLKEFADKNEPNRAYSYEATKIELLAGTLVDGKTTDPSTNNSISTANLLKGVEKSDGSGEKLLDCSKVVDENGEPMVVYHQTSNDFTVFNTNNERAGKYDNETPTGIFFKTSDRRIRVEGSKQMHCFIKADDVLTFVDRNELSAYWKDNVVGYGDLQSKIDKINRKYKTESERLEAQNDELYKENYKDIVAGNLSEAKSKDLSEVEEQLENIYAEWDNQLNQLMRRQKDLITAYVNANKIAGIHLLNDENVDTYIVFEPTQIKSATDNVGSFDGSNPDIRYQFIGEKGARAMDMAEEATVRLDNLQVARDMDLSGKDAKTVKLATGWELGGDGKWRYEIGDGKFDALGNLHPERRQLSEEERKFLKETSDEFDRAFDRGLELTDSDRAVDVCVAGGMERSKAERIIYLNEKRVRLSSGPKMLDDYLDNDDLFAAYPELRKIRVIEGNARGILAGVLGVYNPVGRTLLLYDRSLDTVLHEVQHAIQHIEGFATGGSPKTVRQRIEDLINENRNASEYAKSKLRLYVEAKTNEFFLKGTYYNLIKSDDPSIRKYAIEKYWDAMGFIDNDDRSSLVNEYPDLSPDEIALSGYHVKEAAEELRRLAKSYKDDIPEGNMNALNLVQKLERLLQEKNDKELYAALGGEVESRNVQKRLGMTEEARRASLASETEDVAREDQIFLFDGLGVMPLDASLSGSSVLEAVNKRFNEELQQQIDGTLPKGHVYQLGLPGAVLRAAGFPNAPIELSSTRLAEKAGQRNHQFDISDIKSLPKALSEPMAVFRYGDKSKAENVIVSIERDGKQFVVGVHFNQGRHGIIVSDVRGLFNKNNAEWLNWISQGKAEYLDKEKIQVLIDKQRTNLAEVEYLNLEDVAKVVENFVNPSVGDEKNGNVSEDTAVYRTSDELDAEYGDRWLTEQTNDDGRHSERSGETMRDTAERLAEKLNTDINIIEDAESVTHPDPDEQARRRNAKGWYDPASGLVNIVIGNNANVDDVAATVFHEVVAHKGLREMIGRERYDEFLDEIYDHLRASTKKAVDADAARRFANEPLRGYRQHRRVAMDELLGRLAEKGFEDFTAEEQGIWERLKEKVIEAINGFLGALKLPKWVRLGDNELRYILWRSHEQMRSRDGEVDAVRDEAKREALGLEPTQEDILFRTKGNKEYNGDKVLWDNNLSIYDNLMAYVMREAESVKGEAAAASRGKMREALLSAAPRSASSGDDLCRHPPKTRWLHGLQGRAAICPFCRPHNRTS